MKEVYIIVCQTGYGEDYRHKNVSVCFDKQKAQDICDIQNKAVKLAGEFWDQIGEFEEAPEFPFRGSNQTIEKYEECLKQYDVFFASWSDRLKIFQIDQLKNLIEKSDLSNEMKQKILTLSEDESLFLNHNEYIVDAVPIALTM